MEKTEAFISACGDDVVLLLLLFFFFLRFPAAMPWLYGDGQQVRRGWRGDLKRF